jgi:hypothetical protein
VEAGVAAAVIAADAAADAGKPLRPPGSRPTEQSMPRGFLLANIRPQQNV